MSGVCNKKSYGLDTRYLKLTTISKKNERDQWVTLTDSKIRRNFSIILQRLELPQAFMSLHTFTRSGATPAFNSNVSIQNIQNHGTWMSDCMWRYIVQDHNASQEIANSFKRLLPTC